MGKLVHTCVSRIEREEGPTRKAIIKGFSGAVYYGAHGGVSGDAGSHDHGDRRLNDGHSGQVPGRETD